MKIITISQTETRAMAVVTTVFIMLFLSACNGDLMAKRNTIEYGPNERNLPQEIDQINQRMVKMEQLIIEADKALANKDFDRAETRYKAILELDSHHLRAKEGLRRVSSQRQHQVWLAEAKPLIGRSEQDQEHAKMLLTKILIEDPYNKEATLLYRSILASEEVERIESLKVHLQYDAPVSLEFRETDLKVIIEALAKSTGVNFTLDSDVQSNLRVSIFVKNVSLEDALDMLVQSNSLRKKVLTSDSVLIYPDKSTKVRQYQDLIIRSFYLEYANPETMSDLLRSMLGIKQVEIDDRLPTIMIKDVPEVMPLVAKLIASQDIPEPEVMLEMDIIEISRTINQDTGFRWPSQLSVLSGVGGLTLEALRNLNSSTIGVTPNPAILFNGTDFQINMLANPRIRVKNGDDAKIHIGDRLPIITSNVASTGVISENVQYIDVGLKLDVEPKINLGGDVNIKLSLDVSTIGQATTTNSGSVVYQIGTRSTSTQLRLQDGETQVLAGLINDSDRKNINKIPGLGDLPVLGHLFSTNEDEKIKTELVLMITPHIIRPSRTPDSALTEYWVGSELQAGRTFAQPSSRQNLLEQSKPEQAEGTVRSTPENNPPSEPPQGLNMTLPPGMTSEF